MRKPRALAAERDRADRLVPLDVLGRDFQLSSLARTLLFAIAAPRLRGELARVYGILANDPARASVDEMLLAQLHGSTQAIAHELDGDRPLRRFGLVRAGDAERPFAALTVEPFVIRYLASQPADGEPDPQLVVRTTDRAFGELHVPRDATLRALRFLAATGDRPARIVVHGRTGSGRHTLLAALAARAGRSLGVIDVAQVDALAGVLRRAMLRGLVPCVDGLDAAEPEVARDHLAALRDHPGPVAVVLPAGAPIPLDAGYLQLDLPPRDERARGESWRVALERHAIPLADASELAARYIASAPASSSACAARSRAGRRAPRRRPRG